MTLAKEPIEAPEAEARPSPAIRRSRLGTVVWVVLAFAAAFIATGVYLPQHSHLLAVKFFFLWFGGTLLGYIGVRVGDAVRRIARPDVIVVAGGVSDALWARMWWAVGPQIAGLYFGSVVATSLLADWLG